jgi:hypothetical protein
VHLKTKNMTETAIQQPQEEILRNGYEVVDETLSDAAWTIPHDSRLPEYDETHAKLHAAGVNGDPVASFTMGEQQFAIVEVSQAETSYRTGGYKPLVGERGRPSDVEYQLDRDMPMVLVHFTRGHGGRTAAQVRAIRPNEFILLARDRRYAAQDPETFGLFDYGDDPSLSRKHGAIYLDKGSNSVVVTDAGSTFGTHIRYSRPADSVAERGETLTEDVTGDAAVGGLKNVVQGHVLHAGQVRSLTDSLDQDILSLSRKDAADVTSEESSFLGAVSTMGTRVAVSLLSDHYTLPPSREARAILRTVVNKAATLVGVLDGHDSREALAFQPIIEDMEKGAHVSGYQLRVALGSLAEAAVDLRRRPALRAAVEDYTRSMLGLLGDIAEANRGIRMTDYLRGDINYILQNRDHMQAAKARNAHRF